MGGTKAWLVCLSAGLFFFYAFIQLNVFDVLNPILRSELSLKASTLSLLSSGFLWADLLFLIPAGIWLDHYSVKRVMVWTFLLTIFGVILITVSHRTELLFMGRFLTGIGNAFCFLACVILVSRWFKPGQQGLMMGLVVTMAFVGGMIAHTPFVYLIQAVGWRKGLWIDVGLGFVLLGLISLYVEDGPPGWKKHVHVEVQDLKRSFVNVLREPQVYLAGLYTSFLNLPILVLGALWGASYLEQFHGVTPIQASMIVSFLFLGSMVGGPLLGFVSDRQGKRKPMMWLGVVGSLICYLPLMWGGVHAVVTLSAIFFGLGLFTSTQIISYPLLSESFPPRQVGEATSIASLIIMGGGAVGQLLFGSLMQYQAGKSLVYSSSDFHFAMSIFPLAFALAAVFLKLIRETHCRREELIR